MSIELGAAGQGASEGLDKALQRLFLQQKLEEEKRHSMEEERQGRDVINQNEDVKKSLAEERRSKDAAAKASQDEETHRYMEEGTLQDEWALHPPDLSTPTGKLQAFLKLRPVVKKGETIPYQLFGDDSASKVNNEAKIFELTDPIIAKSVGKKVGDRISVDYNPRTTARTFQGVDVSKGIKPYEAPQQPSFSPVQSGEGYITFDRKAGKFKDTSGKEVENPALATTSSTRTMAEGAKMLLPRIDGAAAQAEELDKVGLFGPIMSRVRELATKMGTVQGLGSDDLDTQQKALNDFGNAIAQDPALANDRKAGRFSSTLGLLATGAGRVHGGARGGGSPLMLDHFKHLLSGSSTLPMFLGRLDALKDFMNDYASGPNPKEQGGGLPSVGGTFNGGKVLSVTPIKQD